MSAPASHQHPLVLILGAGIGGLTLAQSLRKRGIPFLVFERDSSMDSRSQGWAVAMHTILDDIEASFPDDLEPINCTSHLLPLELPAQLCFYKGDRKFFVESSKAHKVIRCNRQKLREWLATNINVQWGKHVTRIEETEKAVTLTFSNGSSVSGDVLVGADGAHSVVRSHILPHVKLDPAPMSCINGEVTLTGTAFQNQLRLAHSSYTTAGPGFHIFVGLSAVAPDAQSADYYWFLVEADADVSNPQQWRKTASKPELLDYALKRVTTLAPKFTEAFQLTTSDGMKTPPVTFWEVTIDRIPEGRITLVGDAAHSMTPFRGEGGVHAAQDSLNLARALDSMGDTPIAEALKRYEAEMLPRGLEAMTKSRTADDASNSARIAWGATVQEATPARSSD